MRSVFMGSIVVLVALITFSLGLQAQTAPPSGAAKAIPNLSGLWETSHNNKEPITLCGEPACRAVAGLPPPYQIFKIKIMEEPQMQPWAEEQYKVAREGLKDPNDFGRDEVNPWLSGCVSLGPAGMMLNTFADLELRQFPDVVLLLAEDDHAVRRIYLNGKHPADWKPTWMGHSIGRYDADTLVVDTIGISDRAWIDLQGHPHSDALHLVERIRRVDLKTLEIEVTIDDPTAYKKPWTTKIVRELAPPGVRIGEDVLCDELLKMGTHYSVESKK